MALSSSSVSVSGWLGYVRPSSNVPIFGTLSALVVLLTIKDDVAFSRYTKVSLSLRLFKTGGFAGIGNRESRVALLLSSIKLPNQSRLNLLRAPFPFGYFADVRTVNAQTSRNTAVDAA
jgi:hypothetical protein